MSKVLLIDAGNTRVKWLIAERLAESGLAFHSHEQAALLTAEVLSDSGLVSFASEMTGLASKHGVGEIFLAHVLGPVWVQELRQALTPLVLTCPEQGQSDYLATRYQNPDQLGLDRWLACLAVAHQTSTPLNLVVSLGTATTVDGLVHSTLLSGQASHQFVHLGGVIAPGPQTMLNSLNQSTQQLPLANLSRNDWPTCTEEAIGEGVMSAQVSIIESKATLIQRNFPQSDLTIWLSGGYSDQIQLSDQWRVLRTQNLIFEGLIRSRLEASS